VAGLLTRPRAILKWLGRAAKRNRHTFAFTGNNVHYTAIASLFMLDFAMAGILLLIMGIIVVLPMSSDPLRAIPPARMRLWPLEDNERRVLRLVSPLLNPLTWIVVALAVWKGASLGIVALAAGVVATGFLASSLTSARASGGGVSLWRWLPNLPIPLNHLIRKNLREMLSTLDFFCGALIALAALGWRVAGLLPPAAFFPLTIVAMLAISTCALTLFGLDGAAGMKRYRMMPLRGWQILLAKDAAFLAIAVVFALPLSIPGAIGSAFIALAVGHRTSIGNPRRQLRWRFQTGPSFGEALGQIIPMVMAGAAIVYSGTWVLLICVAAWAGSVWYFGRVIDRTWH
jgi:hypothetical protein